MQVNNTWPWWAIVLAAPHSSIDRHLPGSGQPIFKEYRFSEKKSPIGRFDRHILGGRRLCLRFSLGPKWVTRPPPGHSTPLVAVGGVSLLDDEPKFKYYYRRAG